jgi:hypothetical protein
MPNRCNGSQPALQALRIVTLECQSLKNTDSPVGGGNRERNKMKRFSIVASLVCMLGAPALAEDLDRFVGGEASSSISDPLANVVSPIWSSLLILRLCNR